MKPDHVLVTMDELHMLVAKIVMGKNVEALQLIKNFHQVDLSDENIKQLSGYYNTPFIPPVTETFYTAGFCRAIITIKIRDKS